jgi:hypothetical protein
MNEQSNSATGVSEPNAANSQSEDYRWIKCLGCAGNVGIPLDWKENTVECPHCGLSIQGRTRFLYRPAPDQAPAISSAPASAVASSQKVPSLDLANKSQTTMLWGIASIVLGWTIVVPVLTLCLYCDTSTIAEKERLQVPGKATFGLVLALLFGVVQGFAAIAHLAK